MANRPAKFTQVDVRRALKAAKAIDPELTVQILADGSLLIVRAPNTSPEKPVDARPQYVF